VKKYVIIAGANGAGKSTLYQMNDDLKNMPRVNPDEITEDIGDWRKRKDVIAAGRIALKKIRQYMQEGITFHQETTLCGGSTIKHIRKAKEAGYFIELHYVGVDSAEIEKDRIRHRVEKGGHDISEAVIEKRNMESFQQLNKILKDCDQIVFYDNTETFRRFAVFENGALEIVSQEIPAWFSKVDFDVNVDA